MKCIAATFIISFTFCLISCMSMLFYKSLGNIDTSIFSFLNAKNFIFIFVQIFMRCFFLIVLNC